MIQLQKSTKGSQVMWSEHRLLGQKAILDPAGMFLKYTRNALQHNRST
jgi:hypothetical protein